MDTWMSARPCIGFVRDMTIAITAASNQLVHHRPQDNMPGTL